MVHVILALVIGAVVWRVADQRWATTPSVITFDAPMLGDAAVAVAGPAAEAPVARGETFLESTAAALPRAVETAPAMTALSDVSVAEVRPRGAGASGLSTALTSAASGEAGGENFAPPPPPGAVRFAGLGAASARSVVYVVDCSGSMVTSLPFVIAEVERSVSRLSPTQKFGVVLFRAPPGANAAPDVEVFAPVLLRATPSAQERLHAWLAAARPSGRSAPLPGLERAIAYRPDAVFLLSRAIERSGGSVWDLAGATSTAEGGEAALSRTLARIDAINPLRGERRPVLIQTIQFLDDDPTGIMQEIGRRHGAAQDASGAWIPGYRVIRRGEEIGGQP